ncbi:MAG TPA: SDR family oxidoreductase [Anaerolineae bacterium]|nr:SDR family oxidoreductase [Anaerolineae bacterium]
MRYQSVFRDDLFAGQTILVSGGGSGIGRTTAHELASLGGTVLLVGRTEEKLVTVVEEIEGAGGVARWRVCNIREEDEVVALFEWVAQEYGVLHGLFNNAGGQFLSPAEGISRRGWQAVIETNLTGTFLMCREAYRQGMKEHGGAIVNMLIEMWRGFPGMAHSGAARAGIENLTKTLAVEWAVSGVRLNGVAPGLIRSTGLSNYGEAMQPMIEAMQADLPSKRMGTESEVAAAVTFLLSPAASYISGTMVRIDGASSLWRKMWEIDAHENWEIYDGWG